MGYVAAFVAGCVCTIAYARLIRWLTPPKARPGHGYMPSIRFRGDDQP